MGIYEYYLEHTQTLVDKSLIGLSELAEVVSDSNSVVFDWTVNRVIDCGEVNSSPQSAHVSVVSPVGMSVAVVVMMDVSDLNSLGVMIVVMIDDSIVVEVFFNVLSFILWFCGFPFMDYCYVLERLDWFFLNFY